MTAGLDYEYQYYRRGLRRMFGVDESGRGPWAGPVVAGAVCLPLDRDDLLDVLEGVRDSKKMTAMQRVKLTQPIQEVALAWGVGHAMAEEIDAHGIVAATKLAMRRALEAALAKADFKPDLLLLDSMKWPEMEHIPQKHIVRGDQYSLSIAAASVLAKVWRDEFMRELDQEFPHYGFARHKGYGTRQHQAALEKYGPSPHHRMYYKPLQRLQAGAHE